MTPSAPSLPTTHTGIPLIYIYIIYTNSDIIYYNAIPTAKIIGIFIVHTCPIKIANTKTPISQLAVMNKYSASFSGCGFFPMEVAVFVAKKKQRMYLQCNIYLTARTSRVVGFG